MWRTLSACILSVFLSLPVAEAAPEQPVETPKQQAEGQIVVPPFDLPEKDILEMKEKAQRLKPLIEKDRELSRMRERVIDEVPGVVPVIHLAYGYGSVINLPYSFNVEDIAIGAREKFSIETRGNSLIIFPVREFKSTNIVVFERTQAGDQVSHHYLLVENGASGEADLTVNVRRSGMGGVTEITDAIVRIITTQRIPEKGAVEDILLEGRSPSLTELGTYPFIRMMKLVKPELHVFMIAGKVMPVGNAEFALDLGNGTSVVASRSREITVRRIADGKTFSITR
ncbi:MAG: hypothetical protein A4E61_00588 [Syntrophorhabdus sp. PtaB.Bin184]|nr:MAG: hypothetical protein A4E61_00588 [Syntrophorhabdus sp. PtaB.Bin184]